MSQSTFDPNGVGLKNDHFIGLPFQETDANIVLVSVPWDVTTSYRPGTASGPQNVLEASSQLDLADLDLPDAWKKGIFLRPSPVAWLERNEQLRPKARQYIEFLEGGGRVEDRSEMQAILAEVNDTSAKLKGWVRQETGQLLDKGKMVGIVGGEHSVPLGFLEALAERHEQFSILQIDAHMDLRQAYEGFVYSHASIFYNAMAIDPIDHLVQVGIRDWCDAEQQLAEREDSITVYFDQDLREQQYQGVPFDVLCQNVIAPLSPKVYVSFDIDGLDPALCPNTGTPVPGGLQFQEAMYLIKKLVGSGREIIGFDLCEVAGLGNEWDGNVGARVLYKLASWMSASR